MKLIIAIAAFAGSMGLLVSDWAGSAFTYL